MLAIHAPAIYNVSRYAGVGQLFRVRFVSDKSQGNLPVTTCCQQRSCGVAERDRSLPGQGKTARLTFVHFKTQYAGVAQLFRARPCQGRGQGLESPHPHQRKSPDENLGFFFGMDLEVALTLGRVEARVRSASGTLQGNLHLKTMFFKAEVSGLQNAGRVPSPAPIEMPQLVWGFSIGLV